MFQPKRPPAMWSIVVDTRASMKGGHAIVDIVATTPSREVAAEIIAASGIGSCFGTCSAWVKDISAVPAQASGRMSGRAPTIRIQ
jgi:hypothetical protein